MLHNFISIINLGLFASISLNKLGIKLAIDRRLVLSTSRDVDQKKKIYVSHRKAAVSIQTLTNF